MMDDTLRWSVAVTDEVRVAADYSICLPRTSNDVRVVLGHFRIVGYQAGVYLSALVIHKGAEAALRYPADPGPLWVTDILLALCNQGVIQRRTQDGVTTYHNSEAGAKEIEHIVNHIEKSTMAQMRDLRVTRDSDF
jgi:hypothetical protein